LKNTNCVKVIKDAKNNAIYFSRHPIPFVRDFPEDKWLFSGTFYKHLGFYAFDRDSANRCKKMKQSNIELSESLEQLTWLHEGLDIHCVDVSIGVASVDTAEDLQFIINVLEGKFEV
jgi:3-deoxy-manno-octulosonate cytidylyltransferase (CMP-KDO synthetase)